MKDKNKNEIGIKISKDINLPKEDIEKRNKIMEELGISKVTTGEEAIRFLRKFVEQEKNHGLYIKGLETLVLDLYEMINQLMYGYKVWVDFLTKQNKEILENLDEKTRKHVLNKMHEKHIRKIKEKINKLISENTSFYIS